MDQFPGNTNKEKEEKAPKAKAEKQIKKVVTGEVSTRKKPLGHRFKEVFLGGDAQSAVRYIAADVLLPALRNMIVDATTKGIERMVFGDTSMRGNRSIYQGRSRIQYSSPINRPDPRASSVYLPDQPPRARRQGADDIVLASREEADAVIEQMCTIIDQYEVASVADLYETLGMPHTHVDQKFGWGDFRYAQVRQIRQGYLLILPPYEEI